MSDTTTNQKPISKKDKAMLAEVREVFKEHMERDLQLTDNALLFVIEKAGDKWDDMEPDDVCDYLEKQEKAAEGVAVADPGISKLVKKLDEDEAAMVEIEEDIEATMRQKVTTPRLYAVFKRLFTKEELDGAPYPGTTVETVKGNYKPDTVTRTAANGIDKITTTWTHDFVSTMRRGKDLEGRIDDVNREIKEANSSTQYKGWGTESLTAEKTDLTARRNALRSMVKRTFALHHTFEGIVGMPLVTIRWAKDKRAAPQGKADTAIHMPVKFNRPAEGNNLIRVTASPKNIWMEPKDEGENGKLFSVTQLLAYDVAKAIANGGTMADLTKTATKAPKAKAGQEGTGEDMPIDEAYTAVNRFIHWIKKRDNAAQLNLLLANPKAPELKDWRENVSDLYHNIRPIYMKFRKDIEKTEGSPMNEGDATEQQKGAA